MTVFAPEIKPHPDSDSSQETAHSLFRLQNAVMKAMRKRFYPLFIAAIYFAILNISYQIPAKIVTKKLNIQRTEDYTFEGMLNRAKEECSYMSLVNDTVFRNRTLHIIKEKIARKTLEDFYKQKEREKQRAKEYYENIERQTRRRVLVENGPFNPGFAPPRPLFPPPGPPIPPSHVPHRHIYKRSDGEARRRRKGSGGSFAEVSFIDHNNCSSRCLFARMEMVNSYGFPDESLISKLIEDKIPNKKNRLIKAKKVASCFKKMEEVAFDDTCIFSTKLFDCMDLGEEFSWSGMR